MKKLTFIISGTFILICLYFLFFYKKEVTKIDYEKFKNEVAFFVQITDDSNISKSKHKFQYYDKNGDFLYEEEFMGIGDVLYSGLDENYIYSFGPGGLYMTDQSEYKTKNINNDGIIVQAFIYNNKINYLDIGKNQICEEKDCFDIGIHIKEMMRIDDRYYCRSSENKIFVYDKKNLKYTKIIDENIQISGLTIINDKPYIITTSKLIPISQNDQEIIDLNKPIDYKVFPINFSQNGLKYFSVEPNEIYNFSPNYKLEKIKITKYSRNNYNPKNNLFISYKIDYRC